MTIMEISNSKRRISPNNIRRFAVGKSQDIRKAPTKTVRPLSKKIVAVQKAHAKLSSFFRLFRVRHVNRVFGPGLVRVCSRTIIQIDGLPAMFHYIASKNWVHEIGMPVDCGGNMKSLVMFIKPVNVDAGRNIESFFKQSFAGYKVVTVDIDTKVPEVNTLSKFEESKQLLSQAAYVKEKDPMVHPIIEVQNALMVNKRNERPRRIDFFLVVDLFILCLLFLIALTCVGIEFF